MSFFKRKIPSYVCDNLSEEKLDELYDFLKYAQQQGMFLGMDEQAAKSTIKTLCATFKTRAPKWERSTPNVMRAKKGVLFSRSTDRKPVTADQMASKTSTETAAALDDECVKRWLKLLNELVSGEEMSERNMSFDQIAQENLKKARGMCKSGFGQSKK